MNDSTLLFRQIHPSGRVGQARSAALARYGALLANRTVALTATYRSATQTPQAASGPPAVFMALLTAFCGWRRHVARTNASGAT